MFRAQTITTWLIEMNQQDMDTLEAKALNALAKQGLFALTPHQSIQLMSIRHHIKTGKIVLLAEVLSALLLRGDQVAVENIIRSRPLLLLEKYATQDVSGKLFENVTPLQMALRLQDVEMGKMLASYFYCIDDGDEIKKSQLLEEFPNGNIVLALAFDLQEIISSVNDCHDCNKIPPAINAFKRAFQHVALQEKHFNPQHLINAFNLYDAFFSHWDWNQRDLFWVHVIGFMQRFLPASYAHAFCGDPQAIIEEGEKVNRSLIIEDRMSNKLDYYPDTWGAETGLGYEYACFGVAVASTRGLYWPRQSLMSVLYEKKSQALQQMAASVLEQRSICGCFRC